MRDGDPIRINIPDRTIDVAIDAAELDTRRGEMESRGTNAWQPEEKRERTVSKSLRAYALMTTSASKGAVRDPDQVVPKR